jgi:tetratricopeptide (TPR) repeat protein
MSAARRTGHLALLIGGLFSAGLVTGPFCGRLKADDAPPVGRKLAFLVGIREYNHLEFKDLDFPENDVEELATVLSTHGFRTVVLSTARGKRDGSLKPTGENIRAQLKSLIADVTKHDLIIVGLAGHGIQPIESDESFFCPMDANPVIENGRLVEPQRLISLGELLGQLRKSGIGDKLVLIDACRNDPTVRGRRGVDHVNVSALPSQTGVLLSCSQGEFSFENKSLGSGHGAFFYHVIEGFNGSAKDQEGTVTWDSLRTYVKTQVPRTVEKLFGKDGGEQNPNEIGNLRGTPPVLVRIDRGSIPPAMTNPPSRLSPSSNPDNVKEDIQNDPWIKKAEHFREIGDYDSLGNLVKKRLRELPESANGLTYQSLVLSADDRDDDAMDTVNKAIRLDKEIALAYAIRGGIYAGKADYDVALHDYNEAVRLAPQSAEFITDRGWCFVSMSSYNQALADANRARELDAEYASAYRLRASAKFYEGGGPGSGEDAAAPDAREAIRIYQKQVATDPENQTALRGLAIAYSWNGEYARAIESYNTIMRKGWARTSDFTSRGTCYVRLEKYEWAIADYSRAIQRLPGNALAYERRATANGWLQRYDDAIRDATEAIRLDPKNAIAYDARGEAYSHTNRFDKARADYEQALRINPSYSQARDDLRKLNE